MKDFCIRIFDRDMNVTYRLITTNCYMERAELIARSECEHLHGYTWDVAPVSFSAPSCS